MQCWMTRGVAFYARLFPLVSREYGIVVHFVLELTATEA